MTVTYSLECSTTNFTTFFKLLLRWRGSVYKLVWGEMLVFLCVYYILSFTYRFVLNDWQRTIFEQVSVVCERSTNYIVLFFFLGFFVSQIIDRWWRMYCSIPYPDKLAIQASIFVEGGDDRGRLVRRTIIRYVNAATVITLRAISAAVKKRFPTMQHLVEAGFLTDEEVKNIEQVPTTGCIFWVPIQWACTLIYKLREEGRIKPDYVGMLIAECMEYRVKLGTLLDYDWICIPLVYTQAVTIAVYAYFLVCLMGRQYLDVGKKLPNNEIDLFFPWITVLQFIFYIGWLKVAETLMNPFGEDDDDFELNYIIERNVKVGYLQVTERYNDLPTLQRDIYWKDPEPSLPHTVISVGVKDHEFAGSAAEVEIPKEDRETVSPEEAEAMRASQTLSIFRGFSRQQSGTMTGSKKPTPSPSMLHLRRRLPTVNSKTTFLPGGADAVSEPPSPRLSRASSAASNVDGEDGSGKGKFSQLFRRLGRQLSHTSASREPIVDEEGAIMMGNESPIITRGGESPAKPAQKHPHIEFEHIVTPPESHDGEHLEYSSASEPLLAYLTSPALSHTMEAIKEEGDDTVTIQSAPADERELRQFE